MHKLLYLGIGFVGGAIVGAIVSHFITKTATIAKYEKIVNQTVHDIRAKEPVNMPTPTDVAPVKPELMPEYATVSVEVPKNDIEYITRTEFGECEFKDKCYVYYADGVLASDYDDEIIDKDNWEETIGKRFYELFGKKPDPDILYVKNKKTKEKYEILRSQKYYYLDVIGRRDNE